MRKIGVPAVPSALTTSVLDHPALNSESIHKSLFCDVVMPSMLFSFVL